MKTAIIFGGFFRTFDYTKASLNKHLIEPTNADIFFNAPRTFFAEKKDEIQEWQVIHSQNDKVIDQSVFDFFGERLKSGVIREYDGQGYRDIIDQEGLQFRNFVNQPHWRILSQMHGVQLALQDFKTYIEEHGIVYDVVILTRTDLKWYEPFKYNHIHFGKINHTLYHMMSGDAGCYKDLSPDERNAHEHRKRTGYASVHGTDKTFNDHILVGTQQMILTYSNIYDMVMPYVRSGVIFNPETIYATHLMRNNIEWQPSDMGTFELWRWEQERWA